ncbi:BlaI/MecI/CopY family transcriptional regulator [Candidatus Poribacteria bacterium]|nr:MAG: BlaI/MecI/CopY family transcriptional regulator [Candidatus Poribacteria bacterium]
MGKRPTLHRAELEVMKIIWGKGEATVRDVWEVLYRRRGLAYTSVASIMRKLEEKGFLAHRVVGRSYVYRPLVGEEEVSKGMLRDLLDRLFEGSVEKLLMALAEVEDISEEELDQLKRRIAEARRRGGS